MNTAISKIPANPNKFLAHIPRLKNTNSFNHNIKAINITKILFACLAGFLGVADIERRRSSDLLRHFETEFVFVEETSVFGA